MDGIIVKSKAFGILAIALSIELMLCSKAYSSPFYRYVNTLPPKAPQPQLPKEQPPSPQQHHESKDDDDDEKCRDEMDCCKYVIVQPRCDKQPMICEETCYSSSFYNLQCDWGVFAHLEFLYWYAKETNLSYAIAVTEQPEVAGSNTLMFGITQVEYLGTSWDPGVRLGVGWNSCTGDFDLGLNWTWMKNTRSDSLSVPSFSSDIAQEVGSPFLINPWVTQSFQRNTFALFNKISARWELKYNQIDLEIGRKYLTGSCFAIRPFVAIRGAFWETEFTVQTVRDAPGIAGGDFGKQFFDNDVRGVGFVGGVEPTWYICRTIAFYGEFDVALLWGRHKSKKEEEIFDVSATGEVDVDYNNSFTGELYQMTPQIDVGIGIRWERTWCDCRFRSALDIGWEHHVLFDQNHRIKSMDAFFSDGTIAGFRSYVETSGNISLGGLVIRGRFDF